MKDSYRFIKRAQESLLSTLLVLLVSVDNSGTEIIRSEPKPNLRVSLRSKPKPKL